MGSSSQKFDNMSSHHIRLFHWNPTEAQERVAWLQNAGYEVDFEPFTPVLLRTMASNPPEAVIIDLARLPSQGRDMALQLRVHKPTRQIPIIFIEGDPQKTGRIRELLPDALYSTWDRIEESLKQAFERPAGDVVVPDSVFAGYADVPLAKKLGIHARTQVALIDAPPNFRELLGDLPEDVRLVDALPPKPDLILWFARWQKDLQANIQEMKSHTGKDGIWIIWPKKTSNLESDLTQVVVRKTGLDAGLVDFKISSMDNTWSGLKFALRKAK